MANRLRPGRKSTPIAQRHGKRGTVSLTLQIPPSLKDELVRRATREGRTLRDLAIEALGRSVSA